MIVLLSDEEILLMNELKSEYCVNLNTVERILKDFKSRGIEELEFLSILTEMVLQKKKECVPTKKGKNNLKEIFLYDSCEQEAIEYLLNSDYYFEQKYRILSDNCDKFLDDDYRYYFCSNDEDEILSL